MREEQTGEKYWDKWQNPLPTSKNEIILTVITYISVLRTQRGENKAILEARTKRKSNGTTICLPRVSDARFSLKNSSFLHALRLKTALAADFMEL